MMPCSRGPSLSDLVNDPLTRLLMKRDGVEPADVIRLMRSVGQALGERKRRDSAAFSQSTGRCGAARRQLAAHKGPHRSR